MTDGDLFTGVERRDDADGRRGVWWRRAILTVAVALPVAALINVIGQQPDHSSARATAATLSLSAPSVLRGGLLFQARIEVAAHRNIDHARLQFGDGWLEGMQISSIEPAATTEESHDGRLVLSYGRIRAGHRIIVWMQAQVDPTNPGRRRADLTLQDAVTPIAHLDHTITVLP